jgi:hypothetical protein
MPIDVIPINVDSLSLSESTTSSISLSSSKSIHIDQTPKSSPAPRMITRLMSGITQKKVIFDLTAVKIT